MTPMSEREFCSRCGFADAKKTAQAVVEYFRSHGMDDAAVLARELAASIDALYENRIPFGV